MKKLAIFVEGKSEAKFVEEWLRCEANGRDLRVEKLWAHGGRRFERSFFHLEETDKPGEGGDYYVLIADCANDERVASDILEQSEKLQASGYSKVIGIRDVRPSVSREEIKKLRGGLHKVLEKAPIDARIFLAVMELEAWFLAEFTHFERFDEKLTEGAIIEKVGYYPAEIDVQTLDIPSGDLSQIWEIIPREYLKSEDDISDITSAIDFDAIRNIVAPKLPDVSGVLGVFDEFFV